MPYANAVVEVFNGDVAHALTLLKKKLATNGTTREVRSRQSYLSPSKRRNLKSIKARKLLRKAAKRRERHEDTMR